MFLPIEQMPLLLLVLELLLIGEFLLDIFHILFDLFLRHVHCLVLTVSVRHLELLQLLEVLVLFNQLLENNVFEVLVSISLESLHLLQLLVSLDFGDGVVPLSIRVASLIRAVLALHSDVQHLVVGSDVLLGNLPDEGNIVLYLFLLLKLEVVLALIHELSRLLMYRKDLEVLGRLVLLVQVQI